MSDETYSAQAIAAFARDKGKPPRATDAPWLSGYDTCRRDNAAAMQLMQDELADWRTGHRKLTREE